MNDTADSTALRHPALRPAESIAWRWTCVSFCLLVVIGFYTLVSVTNVPAFPGVDQNGYLFGGRTLLEHGIHGYSPHIASGSDVDPYAFVGRMWIGVDLGTANERYYPKYPIGYPAMIAVAWLIGGAAHGPALAYAINPIAMTLGLLFTFLLVREIAGSTLAVLAMIIMATLPVTTGLASNPNSHATAFFCVTASMFFLMIWIRHGRGWRIMLAGLFAGYAVTIRYTEGLLILPLLIAWATAEHSNKRRRDGLLLLIAWLVPVGALVAYNLASFGSLTGYDPTNESTGFSLAYASDNWLTMLELFATGGIALFFPFALAGLIALCKWRWRLALILLSWIIPSIVVYTFYYWAPNNVNALGYMRFFLTVIPGLLAAAMAMFAGLMEPPPPEVFPDATSQRAGVFPDVSSQRAGPSPAPAAPAIAMVLSPHLPLRRFWIVIAGTLAAVAALLNLGDAVPDLLVQQVRRLALADRTRVIQSVAPPGSVIFTPESDVLHHLQFVGDYTLYSTDIFNARRVDQMGEVDPDEPMGFQPQRQLALYDLLKDKSSGQLWAEARTLIAEAAAHGHATYVVEPLRVYRNRPPPFVMQPVVNAKGWTSQQVAAWANTTVGDHTPQPGVRRSPRRRDPFFNYRASRDAGHLVEITPPPEVEDRQP